MAKPISLRPDAELRATLEQIAEKQDRSLNKTVIMLLKKAIKEEL